MDSIPPMDNARGVAFTVADFVEAGRDRLRLGVVTGGSGLAHTIDEPLTNRPGLALTGFFDNFAWERIQLIGNAEAAYIRSLGEDMWLERFDQMIRHGAYAFVCTGGRIPCERVRALAERSGVVLLVTSFSTQDFSRNAAFVLEQLGAPRMSIYGTMVEVCGLGVLFEGDPGLGKSETALGLIKRGWSLVADDLTCIRRGVGTDVLYASASESTAGYMEIRGIGILHVPSVFGISAVRGEKRLQLVITFKRLQDIRGEVDRIGQTRRTRSILGVDVPNIIIPVSEGRDLVNLVETAVQQQQLIDAGYNPVRDLSKRLHKRAEKPTV
ncbi:MAG: HPr(Ser) kinase/phosphatase [Kiritimatiellae bacterium]|nr:HPr(Ser) kinase/phosphatase [Kiritimatiellia bacterium]